MVRSVCTLCNVWLFVKSKIGRGKAMKENYRTKIETSDTLLLQTSRAKKRELIVMLE